jgi:uncharacterized protein (DUF983 family)
MSGLPSRARVAEVLTRGRFVAKKEFPEYVYSASGSLLMRCPACKEMSLGDAIDVFVHRHRGACIRCGHELEPVTLAAR